MCNSSIKTNEAIALLSGSLMVGNHDTITLFGVRPQNCIRDCIKRVISLLLKDSECLDTVTESIFEEINLLEQGLEKLTEATLNKSRRHADNTKNFQKILFNIENFTAYLKLQEVQLIKEIKLLENADTTLLSCTKELEQHIQIAKTFLLERDARNFSQECPPSCSTQPSGDNLWYSRLEHRINDLDISFAVSSQIRAQVKLLHASNLLLLDKLRYIISNIIPLWQSQMSIFLGIELSKDRLTTQEMLLHTTSRPKKITSFERIESPDSVFELNKSLRSAFSEILLLNKDNSMIREEIDHTISLRNSLTAT